MAMTVDLPPVLEEDLREEAEREGVKPSEHAALLLSIFTALLYDAEATPFRSAMKEFLSHRSLDSEHLAGVFEELVRQCLTGVLDESAEPSWVDSSLRAWRDSLVHEGVDANFAWTMSVLPPPDGTTQKVGRVRRSARGKYAHIAGTSEDFARQKEEEIAREERRRA